ncbi:T9SS type A sorting domain-containing protein [Winogradskyella sp. A3E31]|uniref:T9SS type A sorting domain-containing protein n=1 Tax=Winogradskyella sp. A3E31 TaxID=3349637 RepID=UPI00398BA7AE
MVKNYFFLFTLLLGLSCLGQVNYSGNGNTGFGGVIGPSTLSVNDDGTTITFTLTKGGGDFNDALVLYISTGASGRTVIDGDVSDAQDDLRRAISNTDPSNSTTINFPAGFEATHAIAVNTSFAGIWEIPDTGVIGDNGLPYVASANSTLVNTTDAVFTFEVTWAQLGLTSSDAFDFVGVYLNAGNAFTSDEGYGTGFPNTGNLGGGTLTFTGSETYSQTLSSPELNTNTISLFTTNKQLKIEGVDSQTNVGIYNIIGQNVLRTTISGSKIIDLSNQSKGVYLVRLEMNGRSSTKKIVLN